MSSSGLYILDYGAGNVRSLLNSLAALGCPQPLFIRTADDFRTAQRIIFPGVGAFGACMDSLTAAG